MYNSTMRTAPGRMLIATLGCVIMSIGINVFTTPLNLYTTGLMGYSSLSALCWQRISVWSLLILTLQVYSTTF